MLNRRTATRIKKGTAQRKNRHEKTPNYWNTYQDEIQVDRLPPGKGYKHFLKKKDVIDFLELLPNREEIDYRFDAVVLARGSEFRDGWYRNGVIGICAWNKDKEVTWSIKYFNEHKDIFDRLGVSYIIKKDEVTCSFTENQIKAYQLLHILLHELGHHHDKMHTRSKRACARGERYAEEYAIRYEGMIWGRYFEGGGG